MIDIESMVFDRFYTSLVALHPTAVITAGYDELEEGHLVVVLHETSNVPYRDSATDECAENHTRVTYEVLVQSDEEETARSKCRKVLGDADGIMQGMKFRRIYMSDARNVGRTKYQQFARYEVIVAKPITVGNDQVYQMYRR